MSKKREFVMLAHTYKGEPIDEYTWSEKYDGIRCIWIPQVRGTIPRWSKDNIPATGLFSRYGGVFRAPDWFLDSLPPFICDGELIAGTLQETSSVVRRHSGDWNRVTYHVFDFPAPQIFTTPGRVENLHYKHIFTPKDRFAIGPAVHPSAVDVSDGEYHLIVKQREIEDLTEHLADIKSRGGEGLMLRQKDRPWIPYRTKQLLKVKQLEYGEGKITGHVPGKEGGRHEGRMGSLEVDNKFQVSGFTDYERENASRLFPIGTRIRYKFSGRTDSGVPREARYVRAKSL